MATPLLPIFPLPLVLFPGAPQLLHIFEPRYREMLSDCLDGDRRFGVSWVDPSAEPDPAPPPGSVGCVAYVRARTALPDGRSNILTMGEDRYVIRGYVDSGKPYRMASVDTFDDAPESADGVDLISRRVGDWFRRFAAATSALNDEGTDPPELPDDPKALSFQVAAALEVEGRRKLDLLTMTSTRQRLEALEQLLRATTVELSSKAEIHVRARRNGRGGADAAIVKGT
jgi:Lon protease-like protein